MNDLPTPSQHEERAPWWKFVNLRLGLWPKRQADAAPRPERSKVYIPQKSIEPLDDGTRHSYEDKGERLGVKVTLLLIYLSTFLTIAAHIVEYLESIKMPLPEWIPRYLGHSGMVFFQITVCAGVLYIVEKAPGYRREVEDFINRLDRRVLALKGSVDYELPRVMKERIAEATADIGRDFAVRTTRTVRLVDPDREYEMDTLYRGSVAIMGYYPVHSILRDNPALRGVLGTAMEDAKFKKYEMILGNIGRANLLAAIADWLADADSLKKRSLNDYRIEHSRISAFLDKTSIKCSEDYDECLQVRTSFFVVEPPVSDANAHRAVVYVWDKPFGFQFDTVEGAFVIEGQSTYIRALQARFKEKWSSIGTKATTARQFWEMRPKGYPIVAPQAQGPDGAHPLLRRRKSFWSLFSVTSLKRRRSIRVEPPLGEVPSQPVDSVSSFVLGSPPVAEGSPV